MAEKLMFALQKEGVGKTTSTVSTAEILAAAGYRVLVVDFDSQGNATKILTGDSIYQNTGKTIMEAIQTGDADPYILNIKDGLDLIPAEDRLAAFSRYIYTSRINNPYATLKRLLEPLEARYDYIFIDVGPELGDRAINAIVYVDRIFIPVDMGDLALDAMVRFIEFVEESKKEGHTNAEISGILLTMRDGRPIRYERDITEGLRATYGPLVFKSEIRRLTKIKEIAAGGVNLEDPAMEDYFSLVEEIIERTKEAKHHE